MSSDESAATSEEPPPEALVDAADRLERTLDAQLSTLRDLETRAGQITRLITGLLGVLVSAVSLGVAIGGPSSFMLPSPSGVVIFAAGLGTVGLVGSMLGAIITYLSSRPIAGLGYQPATLLSDPDYDPVLTQHLRRTLGVYAHAIRVNDAVFRANAARFRGTLTLLLSGLVYLTLATGLFVLDLTAIVLELFLLLVISAGVGIVARYILTASYLVEQPEEHIDEDEFQHGSYR